MYREMDDKKPMRVRQHTIMIDNRERVVITGVQDVDSFNEVEVVLMTDVAYWGKIYTSLSSPWTRGSW